MIIYDKNDKHLVIPIGLGNLNTGVIDDTNPCEGLYEEGYEDGYQAGQTEGYENGYNTGNAEGFQAGKVEGAEEYAENLPFLTITQNGTYNTPNKGVEVIIQTGGGTNYSYKTAFADEEGLQDIGWDEESIGMFRDNNLIYDWEQSKFIVSAKDKEYYGVINKDNTGTYKNSGIQFLPMFDLSSSTYMGELFKGWDKLISIPQLNTSSVTYMQSCFYECNSLTTIPQLITSSVTDMDSCFYECNSLNSLPRLDTSSVTSLNNCFKGCNSLTTIPLIDTSSVQNMFQCFGYCTALNSLPRLDTSSVQNMAYCFDYCQSLTAIPLIDTSSVTDMQSCFNNCNSLITIPQLITSSVTNMSSCFNGCTALQSLPRLDCSSVTNMRNCFGGFLNYDKLTELGGFIGLKPSLDLKLLPNLSGQSLNNVLRDIYDFTANGLTPNSSQGVLSIHSNVKNNYFSEDEWNGIITQATNKGWTIQI
jgi:surface protein